MKKSFAFLVLLVFSISVSSQTAGFKTHYKAFGEGSPILLINGGPGFSSEGFVPLAKKLAIRNQVIIYDQRGTGKSYLGSLSDTNITMDLMIEDIENLRKELAIEEWVVMGHSFGGMLSTYYASEYPNSIKGIILSSSGGLDLSILGSSLVNERLTQLQRDSLNFWSRKIQDGDTSKYARLKRGMSLAPAYLVNKSYVPQVAERLTQGNLSLNAKVWENMRKINFDTKESMSHFHKPVLIIHGAEDVVPLQNASSSHRTFPNSKFVILDNSSHYGWLDQPSKYFEEIFEFLNDLSS